MAVALAVRQHEVDAPEPSVVGVVGVLEDATEIAVTS